MALRLAVLGDSIAYGQGASRPADTVGARLTADLIAAGVPTELTVLAVPRATSAELAGQVRQAGTWGARLALIIVGANDLTHFVPTQVAAGQLQWAVRELRSAGAQVVVSPAPDLSVVPWVPVELRAAVSGASDLLRQAQMTLARAEGAHICDITATTSAAFAADRNLFSADRFHPSSAGYALIARTLWPAVLEAAQAAVDSTP